MTENPANKINRTIKEQFSFVELPNYFEVDTHQDIQQLEIEAFRILPGESAHEDVLVVIYKGSPNLSFYDAQGKLLDVDHYLPDVYRHEDLSGAELLLINLKDFDEEKTKRSANWQELLNEVFIFGEDQLAKGLKEVYGLETNTKTVKAFRANLNDGEGESFMELIQGNFDHFYHFMETFILFQQKIKNNYIHITPQNNLIITPLKKRSGVAVMVETQHLDGHLLPARQWSITRTDNPNAFEHALIFRTTDIQAYFDHAADTDIFETDRYKLFHSFEKISLDSLVDNTNNLLNLDAINDCFQILASDNNIIAVLSHEKEVTIINTHKSVVPHKWPRKIYLPEACQWMRIDDHLNLLFVQNLVGNISILDISDNKIEEIVKLGRYGFGFEIDQAGSLLLKSVDDNRLIKIKTNAADLEATADQKNLSGVLKNLSHLFKGDTLFTTTRFAKKIETVNEEEAIAKKLPSAIEEAKYDFEANVEHMLAEAGSSYEELLVVQNKVAIARHNIEDNLTAYAEKEGVLLLGQRLHTIVANIVRPSEKKLRNMVEESRAVIILAETQKYKQQVSSLGDPNAYRDILNQMRIFDKELSAMIPENVKTFVTEFKVIQEELKSSFSEQIASEGNTLRAFIAKEIEQVESAIRNTHDARRLEMLLTTHPAALELMTLLKQPFILQNITKERKFSPASIQRRLYEVISVRRNELKLEQERKDAETQAAKKQLALMIEESIDFFVEHHEDGFSDIELRENSAYQQILQDIQKLERVYQEVRLSTDLRRRLERRILERNREDLEKMVAFEGKYAFVKNDPDLYVDLESTLSNYPVWELDLLEKKGSPGNYLVTFMRDSDRSVYRPSTTDNLKAGRSFEITDAEYEVFAAAYEKFCDKSYSLEFIDALWKVTTAKSTTDQFPQFESSLLASLNPQTTVERKALRCVLEKKERDDRERNRKRTVPKITPEFIDETPYFQTKLYEFVLKAKLQMMSGSGAILLAGPPSTGKSMFLKFAASIMNREYFEHAADKWQTKNSLITAIKFGEFGPYATPAGFTRAITTPHSLINIEEIKEWPEALRKSLNPFFAGSKDFIAPDGTKYKIGENILLCAAANLGSMYRQDDEPFTADFWSRIEVVEYDYAPSEVDRNYFRYLHLPDKKSFLTLQDLVNYFFAVKNAPTSADEKAKYFAERFVSFILLPKADEKVKRQNLHNYIREYFKHPDADKSNESYNPEESTKIVLRRLKILQSYSALEYYDLYDHFINGKTIRSRKLAAIQTTDVERYEHLKTSIMTIRYMEGCLRYLRKKFYSTGGQTEIEGTNREFIKCVYLMSLLGRF